MVYASRAKSPDFGNSVCQTGLKVELKANSQNRTSSDFGRWLYFCEVVYTNVGEYQTAIILYIRAPKSKRSDFGARNFGARKRSVLYIRAQTERS